MVCSKTFLCVTILVTISHQTIQAPSTTAIEPTDGCPKAPESPLSSLITNCTCKGGTQQYKNGSKCLTIDPFIYDFEETWKLGHCENGKCVVNVIKLGCDLSEWLGDSEERKDANLTLGCFFTCRMDDNTVMYNYFRNNTPCLHKEGGEKKQGFCKSFHNGTRCVVGGSSAKGQQ
ncbi:uncharacterized protein LOC144173448 [Haemaphysalis longicornis]